MQWYSCENNILFQDKMRFYKGTDQYVVAVTAREEVTLLLLLAWVGLGSWELKISGKNVGWN